MPNRLNRLEVLNDEAGVRVFVAQSVRARLLGLALLPDLPRDCALFLPRCSSVHTFGMRFPLDITFLNAHGRKLRTAWGVPPRRVVRHSGAVAVLERRVRRQAWPTSDVSR